MERNPMLIRSLSRRQQSFEKCRIDAVGAAAFLNGLCKNLTTDGKDAIGTWLPKFACSMAAKIGRAKGRSPDRFARSLLVSVKGRIEEIK
jgi:hypothetical protein